MEDALAAAAAFTSTSPRRGKTSTLRERLRALGASALSDRELLVLLIGEAAQRELSDACADALHRLRRIPHREVERRIGRAAAARVFASLELGMRAAGLPVQRGRALRGPADVHGLFGPRLRHLLQEEFHVVLLDTRHRLISTSLVTRGTADTSLVHSREVFREAVREGASAVILVHNHPSGDPRPSPEDRTVTRQLSEAGLVVGIPVLDHIIVGDGRYVSMAEEGRIGR
jgi:DNA repair protein RadC